MQNNDDIYKKYPKIINGSIEKILHGTVVSCGKKDKIISHGVICVIKCPNSDTSNYCTKTRIINLQDIEQVSYCKSCIRQIRNARKRDNRKFKSKNATHNLGQGST